MYIMEVSEGEEKNKEEDGVFEEVIVDKFRKLNKRHKLHIK